MLYGKSYKRNVTRQYQLFLFLLIIRPILNELNHLNLTFQKNFVDIGKSYDDITSLFIFLAKKIMNDSIVTLGYDSVIENIDNDSAYNSYKHCDFGIGYNEGLSNIVISQEIKIIFKVGHLCL